MLPLFFVCSGGRDGLDYYLNDCGGRVDFVLGIGFRWFLALVGCVFLAAMPVREAHAATPQTTVYCYTETACFDAIPKFCDYLNTSTSHYPGDVRSLNSAGTGCKLVEDGTYYAGNDTFPTITKWCSTSTPGQPGYSIVKPNGDGTCPVPACGGGITPDVVGVGGSFYSTGGTIIGKNFCDANNCVATGTPAGSNCVTIGGVTSCQSYFTNATEGSTACTPGTNNNPNPTCGPGLVLGTVNGVSTCLASDAKPSPSVTTAGSVTGAPTSKAVTNADGSVTTTTTTVTTTTNNNGTVTITTNNSSSTSPAGGGPGVAGPSTSTSQTTGTPTPSPDQKPSDLCAQHPELNMCKNSSVAGLCAATTCTGDAIQCAQLQQERTSYCDATNLTGTDATLGAAIASGADPMAALLPSSANAASVDLTAAGAGFDQTGFLGGGGSCLPDFQYSVMGGSGSFSFARICDSLAGLRLAVMVLASMFAYRMVSGAVLSEV